MYSKTYLLIFIAYFVSDCSCVKIIKGRDYEYIEKTRSFYKIYDIHLTWLEANNICFGEGATLFYPEDKKEAETIRDWWLEATKSDHSIYSQRFYPFIHIGIKKINGKFETVDGISLDDVYNQWHSGEPTNHDAEDGSAEDCVQLCEDLTINDIKCNGNTPWTVIPFVCKKKQSENTWNNKCNMKNPDYVYNQKTGSCYSFHTKPETWTLAEATCVSEGSYLAVINSQDEADKLVDIAANADTNTYTGHVLRGAIHLGFHNRDGTGWLTVKGAKLEESGYSLWGNQQPDGGDRELCGSMFLNGHLNDISCTAKSFFICEHDVQTKPV